MVATDTGNYGASHSRIRDKPHVRSIEIENFMSHRKFALELGPDLNIIIGHNGSGKSSILTALMIGLGGYASKTKRGDGVNSFIKYGANAAFITIRLHNPSYNQVLRKYGSTITVVRKITKSGASLTISDSNGTVQSTKVSDLSEIMTYFGIYPNNVLAMLTQESAKAFLVSDTPKAKYKSLMDALKLSNTREMTLNVQSQLYGLESRIERTGKELKLAERRLEAEELWLKKVEQLSDGGQEIVRLKRHIVWRAVAEQEMKLAAKRSQSRDLGAAIAEINQKRTILEGERESLLNRRSRLAAEKVDNVTQKERAGVRLSELSEPLVEARADLRPKQEQLKKATERVELAARDLRTAREAINGPSPMNREKIIEQDIRNRQDQIQGNFTKVEELDATISDLKLKLDEVNAEIGDRRNALEDLKTTKRDFDQRLQRLTHPEQSHARHATYPAHLKVPQVLRAIEREKGWKVRPVGPLGDYVVVRDLRWTEVLQELFGAYLSAFFVTNAEDRTLLNLILQREGSPINILLPPIRDTFSIENTQLARSERYMRVIDAAHVTDDNVHRVLINMLSIESTILVEELAHAQRLMNPREKDPRVQRAIVRTKNEFYQELRVDNGLSSLNSRDIRRGGVRLQVQSDSTDSSETVRTELYTGLQTLEVSINSTAEVLRQLGDKKSDLSHSLHATTKSRTQLYGETKALEQSLDILKSELRTIRTEDPDNVVDLQHLQKQHDFDARDRDLKLRSVEKATLELEKLEREVTSVREELDSLQLKGVEFRSIEQLLEREEVKLLIDNEELDAELERTETSKSTVAISIAEIEIALAEVTDSARAIGPRPDLASLDLTVESIEEKIRLHQLAQEQIIGNEEEIRTRRRLIKSLESSHASKLRELQEATNLRSTLADDLSKRQEHQTQVYIKLIDDILHNFRSLLDIRGFTGSIVIDDDKGSLVLQADPRKAQTSSTRQVGSLSGGEKSYTQLALLLSVWKVMSLGLVAMDEYDVFMDKVNRELSLDALVQTVTEKDLQCVLITPQDVSGPQLADFSDKVKIHRLSDPIRRSQ